VVMYSFTHIMVRDSDLLFRVQHFLELDRPLPTDIVKVRIEVARVL
jgi:hypothetical protein